MEFPRKRAFSDISAGGAEAYWDDVRSLYAAAESLDISVESGASFHVMLDGRAVPAGAHWFVSGHLQAGWFASEPTRALEVSTKVAVKVSEAMYQAVVRGTQALRILQADVSFGSFGPVIDTTSGKAVLAGARPVRQDTTLEVAELFCGGFNGWSQGVRVLSTFGYSLAVKWLLDTAEECYEGTRQQHPDLQKVFSQQELCQHCEGQEPVFVCANIENAWWVQGPAVTRPHIVCASPPCQPWSGGGSGSGLESPDGRVMLHLFAQAAFLEVPVIVLEQVPGFPLHPHFPVVRKAWTEAGYHEQWSSTVDLLEVAPVARKRFLLVLTRKEVQPPLLTAEWPVLPYRPTLGSFDVLLQLPKDLEKDCLLSEETLAVYMDPWFMPPSRHPQGRPQEPQGYRLRGLADRAPTFLAQYHFQHELSHQTLERAGLYGALLSWQGLVRFFSGAEVALLHCTTSAVWLPKDDRCQMRIMGNSLSPVHAVFPLTLALQVIGAPGLRISTAQALLQCLAMRFKASAARFLEFADGWVLCQEGQQLQAFMAVYDTWLPRQRLPPLGQCFCRWVLQAEVDQVFIFLAPQVDLEVVLRVLGQQLPDNCLQQLQPELLPGGGGVASLPASPAEACLEVDALPPLPLPLQSVSTAAGQELMVVTGRQGYYFLDRSGPHFLWAISQVMGFEGWQEVCFFETDRWFTAEGHAICDRQDFQGAVSFKIVDPFSHEPFRLSLDQLQSFAVVSSAMPPRLRISGAETVQVCKHFPAQAFYPLGWGVHLLPGYSQSGRLQADIIFSPRRHCLRLPEPEVLYACHKLVLAGLLRTVGDLAVQDTTLPSVPVKVQVWGQTLRLGALPPDMAFEDLVDLWQQAGLAVGSHRFARLYSGPKQVAVEMELQAAVTGPVPPGFVTKGGFLLVTYMPELRGGGAKDDKFKSAQTDLAQLFLEKGLALGPTTTAVDRLLAQAGVARVQRALDLTDGTNKWSQIQSLCQQFAVTLPEMQSRSSKALGQVHAEALKRQARHESKPRAQDFQLTAGFFRNADGTEAPVLTQIVPGASGVLLCDHQDALRLLPTWTGQASDELGLVVLGHACPEPSSCQGHCGVPAQTASGGPVLLHACWHNLGGSKLHVQCTNDATVTVPEDVCVCLTVFRDEVRGSSWEAFVANPVRAVADHLRSSGFKARLEAPFGRSFRADGKACPPLDCTSVQFHCRIPRAELFTLLRLSGHTQVYATPKTWQQEVLPGYSVVWAAGARDDVLNLSLKVPDQLGLVRSKNRLGIRVAEANFAAAWAIVRPDQEAPPKVEVTGLFKLLSAPPQLRAGDIQTWAAHMKWQVRPLRCLGPGQWLLGAHGPPPSGLLSSNQQAVLVQPVAPRQDNKPILRAGRMPKSQPAEAERPPVDPFEANDPWKSYLTQQAGRAVTPAPVASSARAAVPPNQQRFDQQESRLQQLEAGLEEVRRGHRAMAQQVAHTQAAVEHQVLQVEQVKSDLGTFASDFKAQLQANADSQRVAQAAHEAQYQQGLNEIKALLAASQRRGPTPTKRPAEAEAPTMELDGQL